MTKILYYSFIVTTLFSQTLNKDIKFSSSVFIDAKSDTEVHLDNFNYKNTKKDIALLIPTKIAGRYNSSLPKTILSYLLYNQSNFNIKVYSIENEIDYILENTINEIQADGYDTIVCILTNNGDNIVRELAPKYDVVFFIPTLHNTDKVDNIMYGGIDYQQQIESLYNYATKDIDKNQTKEQPQESIVDKIKKNTFIFSTSGMLSKKLKGYIDQSTKYNTKEFKIRKNMSYKPILFETKEFDDSIVYINAPILKSSILLSQFRYYDLKPNYFLLTQLGYHPLIFTLSQAKDRTNLVIANSITKHNEDIENYNLIYDNDIRYDWISYATSIGIDSLLNKESRLFEYNIYDNNIKYTTELLKASLYGFKPVD